MVEVAKKFDVKRLKNRCNHLQCKRRPEKEVLIYDYKTKKGLIKLYLCKWHMDVSEFMESIRDPKKIIEKSVKDLGQ
ncbi:MAG: hypothetical protein V1900_02460 [Candidatus Aenigmatarchaeota archaeon]